MLLGRNLLEQGAKLRHLVRRGAACAAGWRRRPGSSCNCGGRSDGSGLGRVWQGRRRGFGVLQVFPGVKHAPAMAAAHPACGDAELIGHNLEQGSASGAAGNQCHAQEKKRSGSGKRRQRRVFSGRNASARPPDLKKRGPVELIGSQTDMGRYGRFHQPAAAQAGRQR